MYSCPKKLDLNGVVWRASIQEKRDSCQSPVPANVYTCAFTYVHIEPLYLCITYTYVHAHLSDAIHMLLQENGKFPKFYTHVSTP